MSFCTNCGRPLGAGDRFCANCGRPVEQQQYGQTGQTVRNLDREREEAIRAGEQALYSLQRARDELQKAKNWGIVDVLGGGLVTSMIKRSKMSDAQALIREAKYQMEVFARELRDVTNLQYIDLGDDSFMAFADCFFDGFLVDILAQSRIHKTIEQVDETICRVTNILNQL